LPMRGLLRRPRSSPPARTAAPPRRTCWPPCRRSPLSRLRWPGRRFPPGRVRGPSARSGCA
jgi:hypothetical protein